MAAKYQQYLQDMLEAHKDVFEKFGHVHDNYALSPEKFQKELNEKGQEVLEIIRRFDNMLCNQSEGGKYGRFSSKLSEKFWEAIRKKLPKIDYIGLE